LTLLRQLLLIPLLAPLLAVMLVGALNPRPNLSLRLLIWSTPSLPIGIWLLIASGGGGLLSAAATGLALRAPAAGREYQRQVRRPFRPETPVWEEESPPSWDAGPSRPVGEPPPTVAVPFRVIQRPVDRPAATAPAATASAATAPATRTAASTSAPGTNDDWGQDPEDNW